LPDNGFLLMPKLVGSNKADTNLVVFEVAFIALHFYSGLPDDGCTKSGNV
jgi:hypothetical protein